MLPEHGIYTLWGGSKPMTMIQIDHYSEEEKKAFYDSLIEVEKKNGLVVQGYNLSESWELNL